MGGAAWYNLDSTRISSVRNWFLGQVCWMVLFKDKVQSSYSGVVAVTTHRVAFSSSIWCRLVS